MIETRPLATVVAPSRLHFGLFVESEGYGFVDGGSGVALSTPSLELTVEVAEGDSLRCMALTQPRKPPWLIELSRGLGLPGISVDVQKHLPRHVGLGSETALRMAVARGAAAAAGIPVNSRSLAGFVQRGGTSGVGVYAGEFGGFIVDEGHSAVEKVSFGPSSAALAAPPSLRLAVSPPTRPWVALHMRPKGHRGLSGASERAFFREHCPIPRQETDQILRLAETVLLPGLQCAHLDAVNFALERLQALGLKTREWAIQPAPVQRLRRSWPLQQPLCLSSLGPTTFALVPKELASYSLRRLEHIMRLFAVSVSEFWSPDNTSPKLSIT
ncbi:beta-ribofuranosylaminobenzene 5'-phosphate synthase family protein [Desertimonas flava]|uniref:beta-ribofuranosylaminobenzene 5'-phosphate synthase family protein n=1 Tax=Desertimonas flava TaxID=2064846 RepID=UPI001D0CAF43